MYRDWTFVEDITDGVIAALERPLGYEIINLGRGEPTLLKEFVQKSRRWVDDQPTWSTNRGWLPTS